MNKILLKKEAWLPIAALIVVGGFIYSFNLHNQLFWDDNDWIINNNFVHSISWDNIKFWLTHNTLGGVGLKSNYYRPFLFFTFAFNYIISGIKPFGYHLFSNFIHIANGILVFLLIQQIFKKKLLAFLTSLIFLIHPLQTEAITYISGRGDALVVFFMLLSLLLFSKAEIQYSGWASKKKILSLAFLVLGLLSRETAIIFPFLALAFYISLISPNHSAKAGATGQAKERFLKSVKQGLIKTWPYFAVVLVYGILRLTVLNFLNTLNFYTQANPYSENLHIRLFTFLPILWNYVKLLFVPLGLHMERSAIVYTSLFQWPVWIIFLGLIGLLAWLRYLYKNQITVFRVWFLGIMLFFIPLGPVSGITPINALVYEHWLYLPMIGFWLIVSFYLVKVFELLKSLKSNVWYYASVLLLLGYLSFFGYQSVQRNLLWGDPLAFYLDILKYEPDSVRINNNVGNTYYDRKDLENAEKYYRIAASEEDIFAEPHYNLGSILQSRGDIYGAIKEYEKAIEINPNFFYSYQNLSVIYAQQGNFPKTIENIEKLKMLIPDNPRVYYNSALIYLAINNKKKALEDVNLGLKYSSQDFDTKKLLEELAIQLSK